MGVEIADETRLAELVASAAGLFAEDGGRRDPYMDVTWPDREGAAYYRQLIADPACLCLVAERGGGHLIGRLLGTSPLRPEAVRAVLESMRVAPDRRREGIGAELTEKFLAWAAERGANEVTVEAYAANEAALAFYRAQGFTPFEVTLRRTL